MNIALIGFYGHSNAGDDRILHCLKKVLSAHEVLVINGFAGLRANWKLVNSCDYVFLGGGGLVQRGTGAHASLFADLQPPLACLGISVEADHRDNKALIQALLEKSSFILVRDEGSSRAFGSSNKVVVGPDLTFLDPFPTSDASTVYEDRCGVNLIPWHFWAFEYKSLPDKIMRRMSKRISSLETFYPAPKWNPDRAIELIRREFRVLVPLPFYAEPGHKSDTQVLERFFGRVKNGFDPDVMMTCEAVTAMRLHASIFACQMGIPFVSLAYQPKNREFCREIEMENLSVGLTSPLNLTETIQFVKANHGPIREHLIEVTRYYNIKISKLIQRLLGRISKIKLI